MVPWLCNGIGESIFSSHMLTKRRLLTQTLTAQTRQPLSSCKIFKVSPPRKHCAHHHISDRAHSEATMAGYDYRTTQSN